LKPYCDTYGAIFDGQICMTGLYPDVTISTDALCIAPPIKPPHKGTVIQ